MPYRQPGASRSKMSVASPNSTADRSVSSQRNYASFQSGTKRHQYIGYPLGTPGTLTAGLYLNFPLLRFIRSTAGGVDDVPPSATASNNYQTFAVMNGSKIVNYKGIVRIKNRGAIGGYLDIYETALSFYDALIWNTIQPTACPFTFDTTTVGPADKRGEVADKAITSTLILDPTIKNFKFLQHYIKRRGTVFVTNEDGGNGGEVTININKIPAKCRRSQTGMSWNLFLVNDTIKNGAETLNLDVTLDASFEEIPSDNRLPYLE